MRNKWQSRYRNKLIVTFMLVSLFPVIIVQIGSYFVSSDAMKKKIDVLVEANLLQTSKNLDTSLQSYDDLLFQMITNDELIQLVQEINSPRYELEISKRKLINMLSTYSYAKNDIRSVAIFTKNGQLICYDKQTGSPYINLWSNERHLIELPLYKDAANNKSGSIITMPEKMEGIDSRDEYGFHMARKLTDYNALKLESIGVVVITVNESVLAQAINLEDNDAGQAQQIDNRNFLVSGDGKIISSTEKSTIGKSIEDVQTGSVISNSFTNTRSSTVIYNLIDQRKLFGEMYAMQRLTIFVGVAAIIISFFLIYYFSGKLSESIRKVVKAMRIASQGSLNVQIEEETRDEISVIALNFNKMMNTVKELMDEVKMTGEKRKEAEIRALEAQINPHFLYNTLDSINWLAIEKEEHQISQMLKGLAQILRYSIKDSNTFVTVREDLEWLDRYIFLQRYRFQSSFECIVEREELTLDCLIPKLILQPFVENVIIHGFSGMKQGGILHISIGLLSENEIEMTIRDNGVGMNEAVLLEILSDTPGHTFGIGIQNVRNRLGMYYGEHTSFNIESRLGSGTELRIIMPTMRKGEESSEIVVIEDEDKTRNSIINLIQKLGESYEVLGDADNGVDGIALIERTLPDLVITDIKMPLMTGIEMLEALKQKGHRHQTVILTGFSEYEYAKQALRLGVSEFLEKPITADDLRSMLEKIDQELKLQQMSGIPSGHMSKRLESILYRIVTFEETDVSLLITLVEQAGLFSTKHPFTLVRIYMGQMFQTESASLKQNLETVLGSICRYSLFMIPEQSTLVVLVQSSQSSGEADASFLQTIQLAVRANDSSLAISATTVSSFYQLKQRYDVLRGNCKWFIVYDEAQYLLDDQLIDNTVTEPLKYPLILENKLKMAINENNAKAVHDYCSEWVQFVFSSKFTPQQSIDASVRLVSSALQMIGETYGDEWVFRFQKSWLDPLLAAETRGEFREAFHTISEQFVLLKPQLHNQSYSYFVQKTLKIINEQFSEGIILEEIATLLHITPEYLSILFTKEVGYNFSTYIKEVRIGKAKALLLRPKSELKMFEIAKNIGYPDPKYFSRVFKEMTGITPAEYQKINAAK